MSETITTSSQANAFNAGSRSIENFLGSWNVRRLIVDRLARASYRFDGVAVIDPSSFRESGTVRSGNMSLKGDRSYDLRHGENGLEIRFPDGRFFVVIGDAPAQSVYHLCGEDHYSGRFFFEADGSWAEIWRVAGPRKRYASLARYRRSET